MPQTNAPFSWKKSGRRCLILFIVFTLMGIAVVLKAFWTVTFNRADWQEVADKIGKRSSAIKPKRGNILGTNGEILASTLDEYDLYLDFDYMERDEPNPARRQKAQHKRDSLRLALAGEMCDALVKMFPEVNRAEVYDNVVNGRKKLRERERRNNRPEGSLNTLKFFPRRINYLDLERIRKEVPFLNMSSNVSGFHADPLPKRLRPYGDLAVRTVGNLDPHDFKPTCGIEQSFDTLLCGTPGKQHLTKVGNKFVQQIDEPAIDGCDIITTLDMDLQDICQSALRRQLASVEAKSGICIMMERTTGDIVAIVSLQRQNNGSYEERTNKALTSLYSPGSVFKAVSLLVGFDDGYLHLNDHVDNCGGVIPMCGRVMRDEGAKLHPGGQSYDVPTIMEKSSNIGISSLILRHYEQQPDKYLAGLKRVGITEDVHLPIAGYAKPKFPKSTAKSDGWTRATLPWLSIGYESQVPPLTTVTFYSGLANGGRMMRPRLIKEIRHNGEVVQEFPPEALRERMASPEAVRAVQTCLERVVAAPKGTGKRARSKHFGIAGKTGTAQIWNKSGNSGYHWLSFVGYFPTENPRYACIVCVEKFGDGGGGTMSAPVFKEIAETVMAREPKTNFTLEGGGTTLPLVVPGSVVATRSVLEWLGFPSPCATQAANMAPQWGLFSLQSQQCALLPEALTPTPQANGITMPELKGYGLRDAVFRLESLGLRVKPHGMGYVVSQSVAAGTIVSKGTVIELHLSAHKQEKKADFIEDSAPQPAVSDSSAGIQQQPSQIH